MPPFWRHFSSWPFLPGVQVTLRSKSFPGARWEQLVGGHREPQWHLRPKKVKGEIETVLFEVNRQMSTYDPASEISRFNQFEDFNTWFPVSELFGNDGQSAEIFRDL